MAKVSKQRVTTKKTVRPKLRGPSRDTGSFLEGICDINDAPETGITMALYGRSGTGKTSFACTFPGKKLLIRCGLDDGTKSVKGVKDLQISPLVKKPEHVDEIIRMQKDEHCWDTIILDTASEYRRVCLTEVIGLESVPTQLSWGVARMDQYGDAAIRVKDCIRDFLDLAADGTNIIIIAQEGGANEGAQEQSDLLLPSVAQDLGKSVIGFLNPACDYVLQTFIRPMPPKIVTKKLKSGKTIERTIPGAGNEFCLRTGIHPIYWIKFRAPRGTEIPDEIVDPAYDKFIRLVNGES